MVSLSGLFPSLQTLGFSPVFWDCSTKDNNVFVAPAFFGVDVHAESNLARDTPG